MKKYFDVTLVTTNGIVAKNPLKISEGNMIMQLTMNNRALTVKVKEISIIEYEKIFRI